MKVVKAHFKLSAFQNLVVSEPWSEAAGCLHDVQNPSLRLVRHCDLLVLFYQKVQAGEHSAKVALAKNAQMAITNITFEVLAFSSC